ncbi:DUF2256 and DUF3253 domain-containing protein [Rhodococcus corynebacterioides]|nr:DUF2256 and DUF3253 domain-containing protein [Rhodococcus corynebacterioides]MBY6362346.1 DUF2256 and DUF3253 domain-containing protein [Rhodococcus corynebacterioides]
MAHRKRETTTVPEKTCAVCGRRIEWRKKWERDWDSVKYCSDSCRADARRVLGSAESGRTPEHDLEGEIGRLLDARARDSSICPSDVARAVAPDDWRPLMEPVRRAARRLVARGEVEITQGGTAVDPSTAKGPIRIRRPRT